MVFHAARAAPFGSQGYHLSPKGGTRKGVNLFTARAAPFGSQGYHLSPKGGTEIGVNLFTSLPPFPQRGHYIRCKLTYNP